MSKDLIRQLKNLKHSEVSPRPEWLKASRDVLMSQIKNTVTSERPGRLDNLWLGVSILLPQKFVFGVVRPLVVLLVVALVGTSGWIATVDASYEAMPGDWLYPAKRMVERTQMSAVSFVGAKNAETKMHAEFAKRRAGEIRVVIKSNNPKANVKIAGMVDDLKTEIKNVSNKLEEIKNADGAGEVAKEVQKNAEQIKSALNEAKDDLSTTTTIEAIAMSKDITEAKDLAKDASVKVVEVLVAKHQDGEVSKADLTEAINKAVASTVAEATVNKIAVDNVKTVVDALSGIKGTVSSTSPGADKIENATAVTTEAAVKAGEAVDTLNTKAIEIKNLIESGNLAEAVSAVKEVTETAKEVEKIQDSSLSAAQSVLSAPAIGEMTSQVNEAAQSGSATGTIKVIVTTTTVISEPGKLPVTVIVTTTPVLPQVATGTAVLGVTSTAPTTSIKR